jgi:hypothetical protein
MRSIRIQSDRAALVTLLSIPLVVAVVAFILAVGLTLDGAPKVGTLRSGVAAAAFIYLTLGMMWLPSYAAGCGWYCWSTKDHSHDARKLLGRAYLIPLVSALFIWFPALAFSPGALSDKARLFPVFALSGVFGGYIWIGMVRGIFYLWRQR